MQKKKFFLKKILYFTLHPKIHSRKYKNAGIYFYANHVRIILCCFFMYYSFAKKEREQERSMEHKTNICNL